VPERITDLVNRLGRTIHCLQFAEGLNPAQWEALRFLGRANRYSRTPSALAAYLGTTKGTASQTVKSLETKGLVCRAAHPRDRRGVLLDLTEAGTAFLGRDPLCRLKGAVETLGTDLEAANQILCRLVSELESSGAMKGFGQCEECTHFCKNAAVEVDTGPHRCGLTAEPLSGGDSKKICVNFNV
jgi:DNA-binding MarR family transcriptional regulator